MTISLQTTSPLAEVWPGAYPLARVIEQQHPMTARHCGRVAIYAAALANLLGLDPQERQILHVAALVHDGGKLLLPLSDELLPVLGSRLAEAAGAPAPVCEVIRHHMERWDGTGFPNRIVGPLIPGLARVLSVADTFDRLTAGDRFERPLTVSEARNQLRLMRGKQLDPKVVDAFLSLPAHLIAFARLTAGRRRFSGAVTPAAAAQA